MEPGRLMSGEGPPPSRVAPDDLGRVMTVESEWQLELSGLWMQRRWSLGHNKQNNLSGWS